MKFIDLKHLTLNNNYLHGSIPELPAESQLVILALHRNQLTGTITESLQRLQQLAVLTLHENSFGGSIGTLNLTTPCLDNPQFIIRGVGCNVMRNVLQGFPCGRMMATLSSSEVKAIEQNCQDLCNTCSQGSSKATFHHNRFSCDVPWRLSSVEIKATAVMGNMLGNGHQLKVPWISPAENQAFLYYSPKILKANILILSTISILVLVAVIFHQCLHGRLHGAKRSMTAGETSRVAASNLAVLKITGCTILLAGPLLLFFVLGTGYHSCSPPLSKMTTANLREDRPWMESGIILAWCLMIVLFSSVLPSMPKTNHSSGGPCFKLDTFKEQLMKMLAWLLWLVLVATLSLPSILFAVAQALPAENTSGLGANILILLHGMAPFLIVVIDMVLASPLSTKYSTWSGIKADRLLMTFRLASAWLLSLLTTIFLHENCYGGWKSFWLVCKEDAPEHQTFNWQIWGEEILNTKSDMCNYSTTSLVDGRCSRAIVDGLAPLLLKKLLLRSTLQPLVLLLAWRCGRPAELPEGRHLKFLGRGPKVTGSLVPLQQMAQLTTYLETLFFWSPLIPLLSLAVFGAAAVNLLLFDLGVWTFNVRVPTSAINQGAALSRSYLMLTLGASCCFQLWHAFSTKMYLRYVLLLVNLIFLGPWSTQILPLERARQWFWSDLERASENEFIHMAIELETMGPRL